MLVNNSTRNRSIKSAIDYFFSDTDSKGQKRPFKPVLLKGDIDTSLAIGKLTEKFADGSGKSSSCQTVSGTIAFAKNEKLNREEMLALIERFEETFFGNMKGRVNAIYVLHEEKESFHIHYGINRICLLTGKKFNPFDPTSITKDLIKAFSALENYNLGFEQVKNKKSLQTKFTKSERSAKLNSDKNGFNKINLVLGDKENFDKASRQLIKNGEVKNRDELITFLKDNGFKLSRISEKYISIENKEGRNFRLKGDIYEDTGKNYSVIIEEKKEEVKNFNPEKVAEQINRLVQLRNDYNEKHYKAKPQKPAFKAFNRFNPAPTHTQQQKTAPRASIQAQEQPAQVENRTNSEPSSDDQGRTATDNTLAGVSGSGSALSAQMSYDTAISKLANARTPEEKARAMTAVAIARANLDRALTGLAEEKKRALNKIKI